MSTQGRVKLAESNIMANESSRIKHDEQRRDITVSIFGKNDTYFAVIWLHLDRLSVTMFESVQNCENRSEYDLVNL